MWYNEIEQTRGNVITFPDGKKIDGSDKEKNSINGWEWYDQEPQWWIKLNGNGAFYRRTDQLDENGNYYLEVSESIILADGTIVDSSNYQLGDGVDGWHWYMDGEIVTIASPSTWEKIKNFFNIG